MLKHGNMFHEGERENIYIYIYSKLICCGVLYVMKIKHSNMFGDDQRENVGTFLGEYPNYIVVLRIFFCRRYGGGND